MVIYILKRHSLTYKIERFQPIFVTGCWHFSNLCFKFLRHVKIEKKGDNSAVFESMKKQDRFRIRILNFVPTLYFDENLKFYFLNLAPGTTFKKYIFFVTCEWAQYARVFFYITMGWKGLQGTNTLAYWTSS